LRHSYLKHNKWEEVNLSAQSSWSSCQKRITSIPEWQSHDLEQLEIEFFWSTRKEHLHFHLFRPESEGSFAGKQKAKSKNEEYYC
jgi:hypothetical protein